MVRVQQKARGRTTGTSRINRPSLREWFYGLYVISPVNRAFLPPSHCGSSPAKLSASVGAPGPHDFAVRTDIVRLTLPMRPSHPALYVRDDAYAPLVEAGRPRVSDQS